MGKLVDAYLGARAPAASAEGPRPIDAAALEQTLSAAYARARAAHAEIAVDDVVFAAHLARCGAPVVDLATAGGSAASAMHVEDLFLCCAGLLGDAAAIAKLRANHRPVLAGYLRRVDASPAFLEEVEQRLWDAALVGSVGAPAKLASYSGRGPVAGWLGVAAQRIGLMMRRRDGAEDRAAAAAGVEAGLVPGDPELAFMKGHLRGPFRRAVSEALAALADRERMVYRMHVIDGLTVERIAKTYGVSQSTVSRWMASARESVAAAAQRLLRDELRASAEDYESLSRLLVSELDLSVSRLLRKSP